MPVLPKAGLVFLLISGQDCLGAGSQPSKACPSTSTAACGYQQGFILFSNHSPKDGLVCLFSKLTPPVTGLFNRDFLLTVREDWQIYYNGLSIMIFIRVQCSVTDCLFHLSTQWIVLTAITLICLNIIHECTFKSTLPLESIRTLRALLCLSLLTQWHCRGSIEGLEMHWKRWGRESPSCWQGQPWVAVAPR